MISVKGTSVQVNASSISGRLFSNGHRLRSMGNKAKEGLPCCKKEGRNSAGISNFIEMAEEVGRKN